MIKAIIGTLLGIVLCVNAAIGLLVTVVLVRYVKNCKGDDKQ